MLKCSNRLAQPGLGRMLTDVPLILAVNMCSTFILLARPYEVFVAAYLEGRTTTVVAVRAATAWPNTGYRSCAHNPLTGH